MVFVNRHLKVPKWFKEWYDKLDPPKDLYNKVPWGKIPYAIAKVFNSGVGGNNVWDPVYKGGDLDKKDWHPKNLNFSEVSRCTFKNNSYLIEALVDKSLAVNEVSEKSLEFNFDINEGIEKVLLGQDCYSSIISITSIAVLGYSMENFYDVPRKLRDGFVREIQKNYLPYVIYLLDQYKEDSPKWK